ncbi:MAG: hypothetical protein FWF10_03985 [Clostridiales bacterium]|nr:hypothetical protein [Clostridiales bacterium]
MFLSIGKLQTLKPVWMVKAFLLGLTARTKGFRPSLPCARPTLLLWEKKKAYTGYREAKAEMRDLLLARENVVRLLNIPGGAREHEPERAAV